MNSRIVKGTLPIFLLLLIGIGIASASVPNVQNINSGNVNTEINILPATISIISPQTGDIWQSGSRQTVRWDYTGNAGSTVNIDLYKGTQYIKRIKKNNPIGNGGHGTYTWNLDNSRPSGNDYWLKITSNIGIKGQTGYFTLIGVPAGITVTSPNGGESWKSGKKKTIKWRYTGIAQGRVNIDLLQNNQFIEQIASDINIGKHKKGSYKWHLPSDRIGSGFQIRVTTTDGLSTDTSDGSFSIS